MTKPTIQRSTHLRRRWSARWFSRLNLKSRRIWGFRLVMGILFPVLFLWVAEGVLAWVGFGRPASFFIPAEPPVKVTTNPWFMSFYRGSNRTSPQPCVFAAVKPKDTVRIFVLGGSAAMGSPNSSFGFARILEVLLASSYPDLHIEVINAAVRGISSPLVASIARECARYQPDLFIVYMGNNELTGVYDPRTWDGRHPAWPAKVQWFKRLRVTQALQRLLVRGTVKSQPRSQAFFQRDRMAGDDPRRQIAYRTYRRNLQRICSTAFAADAAVLLSTVAVNLKDFSPLASLHRPDLTPSQKTQWDRLFQQANAAQDRQQFSAALALYRQAAALDDHFALLHYRWAQCLLSMNAAQEAQQHFRLACDWDALPLRQESSFNEIIRDTHNALEGKPIWCVDADRELGSTAIPGNELFLDHLHFNFAGNYAMARLLLPTVIEILEEKNGLKSREGAVPLSLKACALRLAFTRWDKLQAWRFSARLMSQPPFVGQWNHQARQTRIMQAIDAARASMNEIAVQAVVHDYEQALTMAPEDWNLHLHYAQLNYTLQHYATAVQHIRPVVQEFPNVAAFRVLYGEALAGTGAHEQAIKQIERAKALDDRSVAVQRALTWMDQNDLSKPPQKN